MIKVTHW